MSYYPGNAEDSTWCEAAGAPERVAIPGPLWAREELRRRNDEQMAMPDCSTAKPLIRGLGRRVESPEGRASGVRVDGGPHSCQCLQMSGPLSCSAHGTAGRRGSGWWLGEPRGLTAVPNPVTCHERQTGLPVVQTCGDH